jgi:hypothetical protein
MGPEVLRTWRAFYRHIGREYGVTPTFYRQMYLAQSGRCYICQKAKGLHPDDPSGRGARRLGVDHNHLIGNRIQAVRGLLCTGSLSSDTCNRMIGRYDHAALARAVKLLEAPPAQYLLHVLGGHDYSDDQLIGLLT